MSKKKMVEDLKWVRLFAPISIPKYLIEQIKHRDYTVENFFRHQELNCLIENESGPSLNPFSHLYALVNEENLVKGVLWFVVDELSNNMIINIFSVDNEYWGGGHIMKKVTDHVKQLLKKLKLNKVYWMTRYPKHAERHGFTVSKDVLMEYSEEIDGKSRQGSNRIDKREKASELPNEGSTEAPKLSSPATGS